MKGLEADVFFAKCQLQGHCSRVPGCVTPCQLHADAKETPGQAVARKEIQCSKKNAATQTMKVMFNLSSYNYTEPKHAVLGKGTNINTGALPDSMRVICAVNGAVSALPSEDEARTCTVSVLYKFQKHIPQACLPSKEAVWGSKTHRTNEHKPKPRPFNSRFILLCKQ